MGEIHEIYLGCRYLIGWKITFCMAIPIIVSLLGILVGKIEVLCVSFQKFTDISVFKIYHQSSEFSKQNYF